MKRLLTSLVIAAGFTLLGGLSVSAQKSVKFEIQESQARVLDVYPSTYVKPVIAELTVDASQGRIRDTWQLSYDELASRTIKDDYDATLQNLRVYAVYKSAEKHDCDVVIAATFDVRITDEGATISIVGYPANFTKWTTGTVADYEWILHEPGQLRPNTSSVEGPDGDKKKH